MQDNPNTSPQLPAIDAGQATDESVIRVHAQIRRTPIPASPVAFFSALAAIIVFVFAWFYVRRYSAEFDTKNYVADREQIAAMAAYLGRPIGPVVKAPVDGAKVYAQQCAACHQPSGQGLAGAFPPLAGSEWVTGAPELSIKVLLHGLSGEISVKGVKYNGAMPAFGAALDDESIAAVASYIRSSWDNGASAITPEEVATLRASEGTRGSWSAAELQQYFQ